MTRLKFLNSARLKKNSASMLITALWQLTDAGLEELKVLQTIILLVTTTDVVKHQLLAKVTLNTTLTDQIETFII